MVASEGGHLFDETPLLVATEGALDAVGLDRRRFRPNLVIGGVEGMAEREWEGRTLRIGDAAIAVAHLCVRCVITTIDPDSGELDPDVLRRVNAELDGKLALNCDVVEPGAVAVGDPVTVHS